MQKSTVAGTVLCFSLFWASNAHAGFFDQLTQAAKNLEQASQNHGGQSSDGGVQGQAGADADHPLTLSYHGSCDGQRSATCMDYNEGMDQCMAPIYGYRMKMLGDRIEWKFKNEKLSDQQRKNLQEDLDGARDAEKNHSDEPTIAGQPKSQRYLSDISEEDQVWVNAEFMRLRNRIYNKCEGADHMGVGHRTEFMTDFGPTGDQAVEQYRKQHRRSRQEFEERAHGGGGGNCMQQLAGLRYQIMADMMEKKMNSMNLSGKDRDEWMIDVAAVRASAASGGTQLPKIDGPNPYRPMMRLTSPEDQAALNNEYSAQSRTLMQSCNGR